MHSLLVTSDARNIKLRDVKRGGRGFTLMLPGLKEGVAKPLPGGTKMHAMTFSSVL